MKNNIIKNNQTFIIAEIGNNHEGNLQLAKKMILEAWKCGVNAIKLQHIIPEKFFAEKKQIKKYKKFQFTDKQIESLIKFSKKKRFYYFGHFLILKALKNINQRCYLKFHLQIIIFLFY